MYLGFLLKFVSQFGEFDSMRMGFRQVRVVDDLRSAAHALGCVDKIAQIVICTCDIVAVKCKPGVLRMECVFCNI